MLIGFQLSDLGRRSKILLSIATLALLAGLLLLFVQPDPPERLLRIWLLAVIALGAYWLSFLAEFRDRLGRAQILLASVFGLLPWLLVLVLVVGYPQLVVALLTPAA